MKKVLAMPLVILSVLAGVLHGYHQYQSERKKVRANTHPSPTQPTQPTQPVIPKPPTKPPVIHHPPVKVLAFSMKKVHQIFNQAGAFFEGMDYLRASDLLKKAMGLLSQKGRVLEGKISFEEKDYREVYGMMDRLLKRCLVYHSLIRNIESRKREDLQEVYLIEFSQGGRVLGLRYRQFQDQATFAVLAFLGQDKIPPGIKEKEQVFIKAKEISSAQKLSREEYIKVGRKWVIEESSSLAPEDFMNYYRLIYFCVKNRVFEPVSGLLTKVLQGKNGILLLEAFASHPTYDIHVLKYFWLYAEKLAEGIQVASSELAPKRVIPTTAPNPPPNGHKDPEGPKTPEPKEVEKRQEETPVVKLSSDLKSLMEKARKEFQDAMNYYRQIYIHKDPSTRQRYVKEAIKRFRKAYSFYEQVSAKQPNLAGLEKTMYRLSTLIYDCQKMLNF